MSDGPSIWQIIQGLFMLVVGGAVSWLFKTVLSNRDGVKEGTTERKYMQEKVGENSQAISKVGEEALTVECVRDVVESSLAKYDQIQAERRAVLEKSLGLQVEQSLLKALTVHERKEEEFLRRIVNEEMTKATRRLRQEKDD